MLNAAGFVIGTTAANIFLLVDGGLMTPPLEDGVFRGIARRDAIALARAEERQITPDLLPRASEMFLTSVLGVRPIMHIDGVAVGDGEPGLITQLIATRV